MPIADKGLNNKHKIKSFAHENVNIFIKEECNQTFESNSYLSCAGVVWVLFFTAFILVYAISVTLMCSSYDQLGEYSSKQDATVQASILSSRLGNEY